MRSKFALLCLVASSVTFGIMLDKWWYRMQSLWSVGTPPSVVAASKREEHRPLANPAIASTTPHAGWQTGPQNPPPYGKLTPHVHVNANVPNSHDSSHLSTWRQAFNEDPALFAGCRRIFLDVGSNRGTHVRKLFEPQKYPRSKYLEVFDKGFGPAEERAKPFNETGICTFGFEANPRWTATHQQIEKAYKAQGWKVKWFAPEAVSDTDGSLVFWKNDKNGDASDWGFSMRKRNSSANVTKVTVPTIDFPAFMEELHKNAPSGYRLMKMDIESAEFRVMPKFVTNQLLCKNVLDTITIEWHHARLETQALKEQGKRISSQVEDPNICMSGPSTTVLQIDDESYLGDGMPLPGR